MNLGFFSRKFFLMLLFFYSIFVSLQNNLYNFPGIFQVTKKIDLIERRKRKIRKIKLNYLTEKKRRGKFFFCKIRNEDK